MREKIHARNPVHSFGISAHNVLTESPCSLSVLRERNQGFAHWPECRHGTAGGACESGVPLRSRAIVEAMIEKSTKCLGIVVGWRPRTEEDP